MKTLHAVLATFFQPHALDGEMCACGATRKGARCISCGALLRAIIHESNNYRAAKLGGAATLGTADSHFAAKWNVAQAVPTEAQQTDISTHVVYAAMHATPQHKA